MSLANFGRVKKSWINKQADQWLVQVTDPLKSNGDMLGQVGLKFGKSYKFGSKSNSLNFYQILIMCIVLL